MLLELLIIAVFVFIISVVFIFLLTATLIRAISKVIGLILIIIVVLLAICYIDASNFKKHYSTEKNSYYLQDNGRIIAGFYGQGQSIEYMNEEEIKRADILFRAGNYDELLGVHYKLIIINKTIFNDVESINLSSEFVLIKDDIPKMFEASNLDFVRHYLASRYVTNDSINLVIKELFANDSQITKDWVFAKLLEEKTNKDVGVLLSEYKSGRIIFYRETPVFKMLKYLPKSIINFFNMAG